MLREQIRAEVAAIEPLDALEREHRADTLAWIDSGAGLFRVAKPATPPKHLVSYFAVVDEGHILLVDHRNAQRWLPTGGHVEPDEHPRMTVAREIEEELGIACPHDVGPPLMVTVTSTVGVGAGHVDVSLWYVVRARREQPLRSDASEFADVRWFSFAGVPFERGDPHLPRFIAKLRARRDDRASRCTQ